jgi:hypothetical protein
LLGQVLEAADGDFNTLLEIGFASSIRREWAWRTDRGESLANLKAFAHLSSGMITEPVSEPSPSRDCAAPTAPYRPPSA